MTPFHSILVVGWLFVLTCWLAAEMRSFLTGDRVRSVKWFGLYLAVTVLLTTVYLL